MGMGGRWGGGAGRFTESETKKLNGFLDVN